MKRLMGTENNTRDILLLPSAFFVDPAQGIPVTRKNTCYVLQNLLMVGAILEAACSHHAQGPGRRPSSSSKK